MYIVYGGVCQGYLYAIGGNNGVASLDTCERYDPHLNKWTLIEPMKKRRAGAGVAELHGYLYVVGVSSLCSSPPVDCIVAMVLVWSLRVKVIISCSELCCGHFYTLLHTHTHSHGSWFLQLTLS